MAKGKHHPCESPIDNSDSNLLQNRLLLAPYYLSNNWILVIIDMINNHIILFDTFYTNNNIIVNNFKISLAQLYLQTNTIQSEWQISEEKSPLPQGSIDSGPYIVEIAEKFTRNDFSAINYLHMSEIRHRHYKILTQNILHFYYNPEHFDYPPPLRPPSPTKIQVKALTNETNRKKKNRKYIQGIYKRLSQKKKLKRLNQLRQVEPVVLKHLKPKRLPYSLAK